MAEEKRSLTLAFLMVSQRENILTRLGPGLAADARRFCAKCSAESAHCIALEALLRRRKSPNGACRPKSARQTRGQQIGGDFLMPSESSTTLPCDDAKGT